jgi:hypothetical protein
MLTLRRTTFTLCSASLLIGCAKTESAATDSAAAVPPTPAPAALTAGDLTGKWDMRAVPVSGDTTPTTFVITAGSDNTGWTLTYPNRAPLPMRITIDGDSLVSESEPYESVRRKGVQVRTNTVLRLEGGNLVGSAVARYTTKGADSVLHLRVMGTRAK